MEHPFSLHYFSSEDALRKKTSKPRIREQMFDSWEDVKKIIKVCLTILRSSELSWLAILVSRKLENLLSKNIIGSVVPTYTYSL